MMDIEVENYIEKQKSPQKEICQKLREIIFQALPEIKEEMKWVYDNVTELTDGKQNPTMRREKIEFDYIVY